MKKFNLFVLLLVTLLSFSIIINAQKSEATAKAVELMSEGRFKEAIAALDKAVGKNKDLYQVYKLRASLKRMTGDFAGAANDYGLAIEQKSDDGELYEQRAMMRFYTRQDAGLIVADLDAAIANGRKHEKVYATRAMIRTQLRNLEGAVSDYETAIGLRPDYARAYIGLAGVYSMIREDDKAIILLEKFVTMIESSNSKMPNVTGTVVASNTVTPGADNKSSMTENTVIIEGLQGNKTSGSFSGGAVDGDKKAEEIEQTKNTAAAFAGLASLYERKQDDEKASVLIEKSLKIDAGNITALETRGKIKSRKGDYTGAIGDFDKVIKAVPNLAPVYLSRGIAKMLAGSEADAQKDFDKFLQLFPNGKPYLDQEVERAKQKIQP